LYHIASPSVNKLPVARIARYNPQLNAIVIPNYEQARLLAAEADAARRRGEPFRPLHGLPLTIKDSIEVAGLRTTAGIAARAGVVSVEHARLSQRLFDAGGILLGKTNVPPYAGDWQADNPLFGRTNNPWDLSRTSGGSTGGGAVAVAAGLTPLAFGSDIAGSIRVPAAFCGIYGHRPSETAVPHAGHVPGSSLPNPALVMAVQGPLARDAADLELALEVIAGPIVGEDVAWRLAFPPARHTSLADFRVAILPRVAWLSLDAEIRAALDDLAMRLGRLGAKVAEA
jgi:amidase